MDVQSFLLTILQTVFKPVFYLFSGSERIFWVYLGSALTLALLVYVQQGRPVSVKAFAGYVFPKDVYGHPSSIVDFKFLIFAVALLGLMAPMVGGITVGVSSGVQSFFDYLGVMPWVNAGPILSSLGYTLWLAIALDFSLFLAHYLEHRVPWLWEFHKTHHSAEVLTPITVYRMHPVDDLFNFLLAGVIVGCLDGVFQTFVHGAFGELTVYHLNALFFGFYLLGYNLRHSHIWLDYGPFWSRFFVSPAQHQIHHSQDPRHFDKNMGFILGFWDGLFGTQYIPQGPETIDFGLNREGEHREYHSVWALLMKPFNKLGIHSAVVITLILLGLGGWLGWHFFTPNWLAHRQGEQLMMEDLTSPEVKQLIAKGFTTVIIPTGGIEQNGPHMVLGKHNYVVRYTAGQIARELGHTLVAPVIPFSPAGEINPPTEHMLFPGTISLSGPVFGDVVEATARSLKQAGFKWICIVGDHGSSQKLQAEVTEKLNREWQAEGIRVLAVEDYYAHNGQTERLRISGYTPAEIGNHAGIRDTSELLRVEPAGVRLSLRQPSSNFKVTGVDGNPLKANPELGERFLRMKINAALRQIRAAQQH